MTILSGFEPHESFTEVTGISREDIYKAADLIKDARFGVIWVGLGIASTRGKHYNASMAMRLTQLGNKYGKFVILANRGHCNVAGFNEVLAWQCGFPYTVDFSTGEPRYQPGESRPLTHCGGAKLMRCSACVPISELIYRKGPLKGCVRSPSSL